MRRSRDPQRNLKRQKIQDSQGDVFPLCSHKDNDFNPGIII
jgi:hypothetical protein